MNSREKARAFAPIAERLGKLVPRLSSGHSGEVTATVEAIGRTLHSAGLDFHDLAARIAAPSFDDVTAKPAPRPQPEPAAPATPAEPQKPEWCSDAEWNRALRRARGEAVGRQPPPWPTWGSLSHFGRIGQLDAIKAAGCIPPADAERFAAFHADYYQHQIPPGRKLINVFNAACRALWEMGARSEEAA